MAIHFITIETKSINLHKDVKNNSKNCMHNCTLQFWTFKFVVSPRLLWALVCTPLSWGLVEGAAALEELKIPHGLQQFQKFLLAPQQDGTKATSKTKPPGPWTTSGRFPVGVASRICIANPGTHPASKFRGGDFSNIWHSSLITGSLL